MLRKTGFSDNTYKFNKVCWRLHFSVT